MDVSFLMACRRNTAVCPEEKAQELYTENLPAENQGALIQELFC